MKLRRARAALEEAGLSAQRIAAAAAHLARARESLEMVTEAVLARAARRTEGGVLLDPKALAAAPRELGLRALAALLMAVSGQAYRPRFDSLERLFDALSGPKLAQRRHPAWLSHRTRQSGFRSFSLLVWREGPRKS